MIGVALRKIFGTRNDRVVASMRPLVAKINDLEPALLKLSDDELRTKSNELRERATKGQPLAELQAEAFAVVREAGRRALNMRHFDVQLIGGAVLHDGKIAEMRTGEGKTLVATLPTYLNAIGGKGVHVVTVNDYLARRDAEWMGKLYNFLGLSVGVVVVGMNELQRRDAYRADITYGQNNEFGFDYLRDNMKYQAEDLVQRGYNFAVVDEVDSILIDEARTPLIISGPAEESTDKYYAINKIIPHLASGTDYEIDLKSKQPTLTEQGIAHVEKLLSIPNLYDPMHTEIVHHVNQALKAHVTMIRDVDYVVKDGDVIIVDEFTGRLMQGRRWSDGLHQAVEAKEGLRVARENRTLATVSFQNYFRMYSKLSGMTGTADTEAVEFKNIYNLEVVVIPTNRPMVRDDSSDRVYRTRKEKYDAVAEDIVATHAKGQPILVGTISIEQSENLSKILTAKQVPHNVLNAKHHEREAEIIAQAGRFGAVTISTNMAGRGTDIILGGNPEFMAHAEAKTKDRSDPAFIAAFEKYSRLCAEEHEKVVQAGGLYVLGTERHESRRIDNQLRGRAGRQGDPGLSRFYISLEDDLMRRFGGEKIQMLMQRLGWDEGASIDGYLISTSIETAQKRVEGYHFDIRKHLLEYDDVMNKQRQAIYAFRYRILQNEKMREEILSMVDDLIEENIVSVCDERTKPSLWDLSQLEERYTYLFNAPLSLDESIARSHQAIFDAIRSEAHAQYGSHLQAQEAKLSEIRKVMEENPSLSINISRSRDKPLSFETIEQDTCLEAVDHLWTEHLQEMDHLRDGIGLRGYGQKNPLHEYQREGFALFQKLLGNLKEAIVRRLYYYQVLEPKELFAAIEAEQKRREAMEQHMKAVHQSTLEPTTPQNGAHGATNGAGTTTPDADPTSAKARLEAARRDRRKMSRR